jgi:hypothetical protein
MIGNTVKGVAFSIAEQDLGGAVVKDNAVITDKNMGSFLTNNVVISRQNADGPLFAMGESGEIVARLNGFLVVPLEQIPDIDAFLSTLRSK